jgi:phage-related protein
MRWSVETLSEAVDREIDALPTSVRARLLRLMEAIEGLGLEHFHEPHVKHVEGKLWELRAKGADGIARGLYVTATGRRVIVLHVFIKKSQRTPQRALDTARERLKQLGP